MLIRARLTYQPGASTPAGRLEVSDDSLIWRALPVLDASRDEHAAVWGIVTAGTFATAHAILLAVLGEPPDAMLVTLYAEDLARKSRDAGWTIDAEDVRAFAVAVDERRAHLDRESRARSPA